MCADNLTELKW